MQLTAKQFRLHKSRAISRARLHARAKLAHVRISRYSGNDGELPVCSFQRAIA